MLNRIAIKELSKQQLRGKWLKVSILFFILIAVQLILANIPRVGSALSFLIAGTVALTQILISFKVIDNQDVYIEDELIGIEHFVNAFLLYILQFVLTALWTLLLIVPGIIKAFSYSMAFYILAENPKMDVRQAIEESKIMTYGHKKELFMLRLSFIGWDILAILTAGIGYIFLLPYINIAYANAYKELKRMK